MNIALLFSLIYACLSSQPSWSNYPANVMYSGEYKAFLTAKSVGLLPTVTQPMYRVDVLAANYFTVAPNVILSLMGYKQNAPANGDTFVGFDVKISAIRITAFDLIHNIYGSGMGYLNYMYLAVSKTNTNYFLGQYSQAVDMTAVNKSYSFDVALNAGEVYSTYPTNTIEMKGFLVGYKMKQGTATVFQLNFTLQTKNATYFTISISVNNNSVLQKVWYYRIGYDRTAIQRATYKNVFRDFYYQLINNVNVKSIYNVSFGSVNEFQYRNYLMGTNKIKIGTIIPTGVEFFLYYYFAQSMAKVDITPPAYIDNPAIAAYLYGQVFYHAVMSCTAAAPDIYYLPIDRKCLSACPVIGYFTDTSTNTCLTCHFTCRTCSQGYLINKCLTCDSNYRVFNSSTLTCDCPSRTYNDGVNLQCPSCHASCLECTSSSLSTCKSCNLTLHRELYDPTAVGIGQCKCSLTFYENQTNKLCQSCSLGCLQCHFSGTTQICQSCSTTVHLQLINGSCACASGFFASPNLPADQKCVSSCPSGYFADTTTNTCIACHFTCKTCNLGNSANNCLSCNSTYRVIDTLSSKCLCPSHTYDDGINLSCPSCHASCVECTSALLSSCKSCNSSLHRELNDSNSDGIGQCKCSLTFYQNTTSNLCQSCSLGCLNCLYTNNTETCTNCNATAHFQLSNASCKCTSGYTLLNQNCIPEICGDGILSQSQQCDDNNIVNNDGCSDQCKVQLQHACFTNLTLSPYSICYFNGTIQMTITDVTKSLYSNDVSLTIKITVEDINQQFLRGYLTDAPSVVVQDITRRMLQTRGRYLAASNIVITSTSYDSANKILRLSFSYSSTFDIRTKKIRFQPSLSSSNPNIKYFYNSPEAIISLQSTYNKIDTIYYDQNQYQQAISLKYAFLGMLCLFWALSLVFIAIGKGNVGMEMMIVYQLAYASLLSQEKLQISFGGLAEYGKYTAGYNMQFLQDNSKCVNFQAVNLSCNLSNNLNISLLVMILGIGIYWSLRLYNRIMNKIAEKEFTQKKHRKYMENTNERTEENIIPNMQQIIDRNTESRVSQFQSIQRIEQNYYQDQQFIPQRVYDFLLDLVFFLVFVTVIIWVLSITYTKQSTIPSIVETAVIPCVYLLIWIFWFANYIKLDFSFVNAHKRQANIYQDEEKISQSNYQSQLPNRKPQHQKQIPIKSKFSAPFLKALIYPIIWLFLLAIGVVLALTQPVGYVSESLILAGSLVFSLISWFINIHKEKLHLFRSVLNCVFLALIEAAYIISQSDSIAGSGLPIAVAVFVLLSLTFLSNSVSTIYLYRLQLSLNKKKKQSKEIENIQNEIQQLYRTKRQKEIQNMSLFLRMDHIKASQPSQSSEVNNTVKKEPNYLFNQNMDPNYIGSSSKLTQGKYKMSRSQINLILNSQRVIKSQQYIPVMKRLPTLGNPEVQILYEPKFDSNTEKKIYVSNKMASFTQNKNQNSYPNFKLHDQHTMN